MIRLSLLGDAMVKDRLTCSGTASTYERLLDSDYTLTIDSSTVLTTIPVR
eukprot:m.191382 g.191382  ORF g.191382 m.191382 type:complete len:50 (-) comp18590_c0_seq1:64-213(-)